MLSDGLGLVNFLGSCRQRLALLVLIGILGLVNLIGEMAQADWLRGDLPLQELLYMNYYTPINTNTATHHITYIHSYTALLPYYPPMTPNRSIKPTLSYGVLIIILYICTLIGLFTIRLP